MPARAVDRDRDEWDRSSGARSRPGPPRAARGPLERLDPALPRDRQDAAARRARPRRAASPRSGRSCPAGTGSSRHVQVIRPVPAADGHVLLLRVEEVESGPHRQRRHQQERVDPVQVVEAVDRRPRGRRSRPRGAGSEVGAGDHPRMVPRLDPVPIGPPRRMNRSTGSGRWIERQAGRERRGVGGTGVPVAMAHRARRRARAPATVSAGGASALGRGLRRMTPGAGCPRRRGHGHVPDGGLRRGRPTTHRREQVPARTRRSDQRRRRRPEARGPRLEASAGDARRGLDRHDRPRSRPGSSGRAALTRGPSPGTLTRTKRDDDARRSARGSSQRHRLLDPTKRPSRGGSLSPLPSAATTGSTRAATLGGCRRPDQGALSPLAEAHRSLHPRRARRGPIGSAPPEG